MSSYVDGQGYYDPTFIYNGASARLQSWVGVITLMLATIMNCSAIDSLQNGLTSAIATQWFKNQNLFFARVVVVLCNVPVMIVATQKYTILQLFLLSNMLTTVRVFWGVVDVNAHMRGKCTCTHSSILAPLLTKKYEICKCTGVQLPAAGKSQLLSMGQPPEEESFTHPHSYTATHARITHTTHTSVQCWFLPVLAGLWDWTTDFIGENGCLFGGSFSVIITTLVYGPARATETTSGSAAVECGAWYAWWGNVNYDWDYFLVASGASVVGMAFWGACKWALKRVAGVEGYTISDIIGGWPGYKFLTGGGLDFDLMDAIGLSRFNNPEGNIQQGKGKAVGSPGGSDSFGDDARDFDDLVKPATAPEVSMTTAALNEPIDVPPTATKAV